MAQHNYLIRGLSGTGKSSVCAELIKRGYAAIDADDTVAYLETPCRTSSLGQRIPEIWNWDIDKLAVMLSDKKESILFICGGATNESQFIQMFETAVTLSVDDDTMTQMLLNRINNGYRNRLDELAQQIKWNKTSREYTTKNKKDIVIDATRPLDDVVDAVIESTISNL